MKKRLSLFCVLFFTLGNFLFAQNLTGARVAVLSPDLKNIGSGNEWLSSLVEKKLSENFGTYTDFVLVDTTNETEIKRLQKESYTAAFDEESAIEVGKLLSAQYVVFSTITKDGSKYSLSCSFTNVTTSETKTAIVTGKKSTDELYGIPGCAVDEITMKLCEQIGIHLSASQIYILQHGEGGLSSEEQSRLLQEEVDSFNKQIAEFDKQIAQLRRSTIASEVAQAQRLEAERAIAEEKLRASQEKAARLLEEAKKKEDDAKIDAARSAEQKKKRDEMANLAEKKAQAARKSIFEKTSMMAQINVIEAKKEALIEIRENVEYQVAESNLLLEDELNEKIAEVENRGYRKAELVNGVPTPTVKEMREKEKTALRSSYNEKMKSEEMRIRNATKKQEETLLKEIYSDYKAISQTRKITSLENDLKYSVGEYNGERFSWPIVLYIYSDGISMTQQNFDLRYTDLTGAPISTSEKAYNEYLDNVDLYDSFFRRGDPVLTFEVEYNAKPKSEEHPSEYEFNFTAIRVKDTVKNKTLCSPSPSEKKIERRMSPVYDIRTFQEQKVAAEKEERKVEAKIEKEERSQDRTARYNEYIGQGMGGIRGGVIFDGESFHGFDIGFAMSFGTYVFAALNLGMIETHEDILDVMENDYMFKFAADLGLRLPLRIFYYPPSLYAIGSIGGVMGTTKGEFLNSRDEETDTASYFLLGAAVGIEFPITKNFAIYGQGNFYNIFDAGTIFDIQLGVHIRLWSILFDK